MFYVFLFLLLSAAGSVLSQTGLSLVGNWMFFLFTVNMMIFHGFTRLSDGWFWQVGNFISIRRSLSIVENVWRFRFQNLVSDIFYSVAGSYGATPLLDQYRNLRRNSGSMNKQIEHEHFSENHGKKLPYFSMFLLGSFGINKIQQIAISPCFFWGHWDVLSMFWTHPRPAA